MNKKNVMITVGCIIILLVACIGGYNGYSAYQDYQIQKNLEEHFGNVSLSDDEIEELSNSILNQRTSVVIPTLGSMDNSGQKSDIIDDIPDIEHFSELLQKIASELSIAPIKTLTYLKTDYHDDTDITTCMFSFPYKDSEAYSFFWYCDEEWFAAWVIDGQETKAYWIGDEMEDLLPSSYKESSTASNAETSTPSPDLDESEKEAKALAETSKDITSGSLYDTVTSIYDNVYMNYMADGTLSIMFFFEQGTAEENAAIFFDICEQIVQNYAIEEEYSSIVFMVKTDVGLLAMLTLIDYESPDSFMSTLTVLKDEYKTAFMSIYEQSPLNKDIANLYKKYK